MRKKLVLLNVVLLAALLLLALYGTVHADWCDQNPDGCSLFTQQSHPCEMNEMKKSDYAGEGWVLFDSVCKEDAPALVPTIITSTPEPAPVDPIDPAVPIYATQEDGMGGGGGLKWIR